MNARRLTLTALASLCVFAGLLTLSLASALGDISHRYETQITGPSPTEPFGTPWGLGFDSAGNLFVGDAQRKAVEVFNSANAFVPPKLTSSAFTLPYTRSVAVGSTGNLYVGESGPVNVDVFKPTGGNEYGFTEAVNFGEGYLYVAFDKHPAGPSDPRAGDLYVLADQKLYVNKLSAEGRLGGKGEEVPSLEGFTTGAHGNGGLAVDAATGNVYVADPQRHVIDVFNDKGEEQPLLAITGSGTPAGAEAFEPVGVAIDATAKVVYVVDQRQQVVDEFSEGGTWLGEIKETTSGKELVEPLAVAVQEHAGPTRGDVYVSDGATKAIDIFAAAPVVLPDTTIDAASAVRATTATLNGEVNPDEVPVSACQFEYRSEAETEFTHSATCAPAPGSGGAAVPVSAALHGLAPTTSYRYRLTATNANGSTHSLEGQLTTLPAVVGVKVGSVEGLTASAAKLTGTLSPNGTDAHYYFEYGPTEAYGSTSPALPGTDAGTGGPGCEPPGGPTCGPVSAETTLGSLAANTVYHYRLVTVDEFGTTASEERTFKTLGPPRTRTEAEVNSTEKTGQTTATLQAQIDPDGRETTYRFEYGETNAYGTSVPVPDGTIAAGEEFIAAPAAELSGLKIATTYHYRLVASNEYGTTVGPDQEFKTDSGATIDRQYTSEVAATSATLRAQINPLGSDTHYYFQYGTSTNYSNTLPALPGIDVGSGESDLPAAVHIQGLAADTTYHYRVVAVNEPNGEPVTTVGSDATFTTQAAGTEITQPDGREWEMVSPPNKQGAGIIAIGTAEGSDIQAAAGGDGITYSASGPFVTNPAGSRIVEVQQIISNRTAPGSWETADITTPHHHEAPALYHAGHASEYELFSSDLSLGLVTPIGATPLPPLPAGSEKTIYLREADGAYKALVTSANVPPGTLFGGTGSEEKLHFLSASPDLSHIMIESTGAALVSEAPADGLYEWTAGQLRLASVLPGGVAANEGFRFGGIGPGGGGEEIFKHAISNDGSRVVMSKSSAAGSLTVYLRDMTREETIDISAAQGTSEPRLVEAHYVTSNGTASRVFFTSSAHLTADATASRQSGGAEKEDLYVFEVTSSGNEPLAGKLTDLTVDGNAGESAGVGDVIGASEDGSYVYFPAGGILGDGGEHGATPGGINLYMEHYDEGTKSWMSPKLIATLASGDEPDVSLNNAGAKTARISPNGRYLAFMSERSLTGYENRDASSGVPDEEVFLYDASAGRLVCASCNPTGARPAGQLVGDGYHENLIDFYGNWAGRWLAGSVPGVTPKDLGNSLYQSRYLSDSGRLFFNSNDALVPADANGKEDVYEYEPDGIGSCQGATHGQSASVVFDEGIDGCVGLISAGTSSEESAFMDASETGGDVFFITLSKLSSQDYDTSLDMYDAHECTASAPCAPAPQLTPPPCTTGDACKPAPTPQPTLYGEPSSETFSGAGNVVPAAAGSGAVKPKSSPQAQKLAKALKACMKKAKRKRAGCERQAKKKYGAKQSRAGKSLSARTRR